MRGTAGPRAHPGAAFPLLKWLFRAPLFTPPAPQLAGLERRLLDALDQRRPDPDARAGDVHELEPLPARLAIELALDVLGHHRADDVAELRRRHDVVVPMQQDRLARLLDNHRSSLLCHSGPAERSIRFGSRGPSRTSRPDRAKTIRPTTRTARGGASERQKVAMALALCSRAEKTRPRAGSEHEPPDVRLGNQFAVVHRQHSCLPETKNRVTVAIPGAANAGRDSLEARGTLKTSPQTVKAVRPTGLLELRENQSSRVSSPTTKRRAIGPKSGFLVGIGGIRLTNRA